MARNLGACLDAGKMRPNRNLEEDRGWSTFLREAIEEAAATVVAAINGGLFFPSLRLLFSLCDICKYHPQPIKIFISLSAIYLYHTLVLHLHTSTMTN